ncbi:discoidin domain-containing protein [Aureibaculum algae]|uniref:Discoidin domain-containing protein n=1 Tax=Aureibaculum algae TaxID=2584122 RepID=A0A5B7TQ60_9FLAO|nr:discoidin domain-containing protein [Aureibaculum algae]QCX37394.1 discoidin domain-containing protein [Aureibaculum algae]
MKNYTIKLLMVLVCTASFLSSCTEDVLADLNGLPDSVVNNDPPGSPARGLTEDWNGHTESVTRQYFDTNVGIYFDSEVNRDIEWPITFFSDSWSYISTRYGKFGNSNTLYVIGHGEEGSSFYKTIFDQDAGAKSLIDFPITTESMTGNAIDLPVQLMSKVVENSANGVHLSPAAAVWQDKFAEIFTYDLYTELGMEDDASRVLTNFTANEADFPQAGTFWFRDWFLPIYNDYAQGVTLSNFFKILSQNYPIDGNDYAGSIDIGQMVHFFSGATGVDLQPLAETAFGWSDEFANQLLQAQAQFPDLEYPFEPASTIVDVTDNGVLIVSKDNDGGAGANEGSLKLVDGDDNTKFLTGGFPQEFYFQLNYTTATVVNKYTITSGNDAPNRDMKTWELLGSNDGINFDVLDTRTDQSWSGRNEVKEFNFDNSTAYTTYKINVLENNGSSLIQISEWRILRLELLNFDPIDVTGGATLTVSADHSNGANSNEGSLKLIDGDVNTKMFLGGWTSGWYVQQELTEEQIVTSYSITSGNDASDRDPKNWELSASIDGVNWTVIDTRTDINFAGRNETKEFLATNTIAYQFYRFTVMALKNGDNMQFSEWRLYIDN